jgi:hypothetical protein
VKNVNKNPVAEKCIAELGDELLRVSPEGGAVLRISELFRLQEITYYL